ncbi:conserved hypothetical protein [Methanococcus vannielii SB]|jgi:hypothetical protein|uniref:Uncharacterized protein n=1 Tax=Methanococcus vannielii (strain ATCC 35089 / DSM 1224 / JCM 13029 / OCM 148 / SB) TaxID=406327 RepID=A6UQN9_METVS|nr:hypothetical protein [Methanococcus vannielii]ABR54811.1 conserved hypothetical protein [Methanococcus vannielii SB]
MAESNKKLKKLAELILLKDPRFEESSKLKDVFKSYVGMYNEICILEDTLQDLDRDLVNVREIQFLDSELKTYTYKLNELEKRLQKLHSHKKISNYDELINCINKLKNLNISVDNSLKWDIYNRMVGLDRKLRRIERDLEFIILNYALSNTEIDKKISAYEKDLFDLIYEEVINYLEIKNENKAENLK